MKNRILILATLLLSAVQMPAAPVITIHTDQAGATINPGMWGIFFEDINFGADGGLYAEMVKNRGFEFPDPMMGWSELLPNRAHGQVSIHDENPFNAKNPHYLRIESEGTDLMGVMNEGFRGMGMRAGEAYDFSAQIRTVSGEPKLRVELYSSDGALLDSVHLEKLTGDWQKITCVLHPHDTDAKAKLYLLVDGKGAVDVDFVSLFPENTWMHRPGGLRADMVQALADLHPGFLRFPGGCIVEGNVLTNHYQWKRTLGPVEERELMINRWNHEFMHRPTPDYYQSFGLGFYEFFQLCEDIKAEPLPILSCGIACQFNTGELCPIDQLDSYIQDALDLIDFANGDTNTVLGAKRAALGHPEPFHLKMIGVGNENWDQQYIDRYTKFQTALRAKHPEIKLVSSAGPSPNDEHFKFAWPKLRELHADIVDEHCYDRPQWFLDNTHRYDHYDRNGPKVFMGEYAAQSDKVVSVKNRNTLECALAEAAYMTGLERNGDVVRMASYAPLFASTEAWQWTPNLIWVDTLHVLPTANYFVQQLFAKNHGDETVPSDVTGLADEKSLFTSATKDDATGEIILKVVNPTTEARDAQIHLAGLSGGLQARQIVLSGSQRTDMNSMAKPPKIAPVESELTLNGSTFTQTFPPLSLTVLRCKAK